MRDHRHTLGWTARLWRDERGATAIEYVVLISLVAISITLSVRSLGIGVNRSFSDSAAIFGPADAD